MKLFLISTLFLSISSLSYADYTIKIPLEDNMGGSLPSGTIVVSPNIDNYWGSILPDYTNWINTGSSYDCITWNPDPKSITINQVFTQQSNDCSIAQTRTRQNKEQNSISKEIRNSGELINENRIATNVQSSRESVGTLETWVAASSVYGAWSNSGQFYGCSNWTPAANTVDLGKSFVQTATDCSQDQVRTKQDREQEKTTLAYRNSGSVINENQTIKVTKTQNTLGTLGAINNNPLTRYSSQVGVKDTNENSISTNSIQGAMVYGPYVKNFPLGSYNLKIYGTVTNATGTWYDVTNDGGVTTLIVDAFPSSGSGLLVNKTVNITSPANGSTLGVEVRVFVSADSVLKITGYTLTPL